MPSFGLKTRVSCWVVFLRLGFVRDGRGQGDSQYCVKGTYGVCSFAGLLDWTAKNQVLLSIRRVNVVLT